MNHKTKQPQSLNRENGPQNHITPNTQSSAHEPTAREIEDHCFTEANSQYAELTELQQRALAKAKLIGGYLNKIKKLIVEKFRGDESEITWLDNLQRRFKGSVRNAQNYMEIDRRWNELEGELKRNPELSIEGALAYLRKNNLIAKLTKSWSEQEREWLQQDPDAFPAAIVGLRNDLHRKHEGLAWHEICDAEEKGRLALQRRLAAHRQILDAYIGNGEGGLTPRPLSELV